MLKKQARFGSLVHLPHDAVPLAAIAQLNKGKNSTFLAQLLPFILGCSACYCRAIQPASGNQNFGASSYILDFPATLTICRTVRDSNTQHHATSSQYRVTQTNT